MPFDSLGNYQTEVEAYQNGDLNINERLLDIEAIKGTRASFSADNDYKVDNLMYPEDLLSANNFPKHNRTGNTEYGNNYVIFYINVNSASKLLNEKYGAASDIVGDVTNADKTRLVGKNIDAVTAGTSSAIQGAVAAGGISGILSGNFKSAGKTAGQAAGVSAIGVGAIASQTGNFSRQLKRLRAAIALHTPNSFNARYSMDWQAEDTNLFQMASLGADTLIKAAQSFANGDVAPSGDKAVENVKSAAAAIALGSVPGGNAISNITGLAANPKKEQIFKGVDFRTFTFDYQFYPKSPSELQNVQNIIYLFKLHMHPEFKDENNFLYLYPSEFDIVHYNGVDENLNLPRHTSCVLTELTVNYAPQSQFTSFEGGAPTQINVKLSFKELAQLTKERIREGF